MPSYFFNILVHNSLVPALRGEEKQTRGLLQKTLERLQLGSWDGGTRVKLLKGTAKLVYEARLNRSLRLLFTVVRAYSPRPPHSLEHYLLAWDVVDHDHIGRARRMNMEPDAGFLDFEESTSMELSEPPVAPEAIMDHETSDPGELAVWINDRGRINASVDELTESIRWFEIDPDIVTDEDEWQALLDDPSVNDLELKLSREQALTLYKPGPLLLRGTAGSGKTTVCVYRLARAISEQPDGRHLLVTYSEALLNSARRLFIDLFKARRRPLPDPMPHFTTFPQLYQQLAGQQLGHLEVIRYPHFEQWYRTIYGREDAALAWEEIRGIIKGSCLDLQRDYLTRDEYEALGRKRAPLYCQERPRLYQVFLKYREWTLAYGRRDDIDLARQALRNLQTRPDIGYQQVICDEGQDLTELELRFLTHLTDDLSGLLFAADPQQIVNPSGFRWAELRTLIRDLSPAKSAPDIDSLTRNYRSVQSIVGIANAFVRVQRERTGRGDGDYLQETTLQGASPVLVTGDERKVIEQLKGFGPRCAVIATSTTDAERLSQQLESERVFDIAGAKGLEFDGCVIWNLLGKDLELWQQILLSDTEMKENPMARRALRHAYVAVTRARRYLGVYEESPAALELWQCPQLRAQIERDEPEALSKFMLFATTPAEWAEEGDYFLERGRYRQAAECYRRAGSRRQEQLATAAWQESVGHYRQAAELFVALQELGRAAPCLAMDKRYTEAAAAFESIRDWRAAAANYEAAGLIKQAADTYQKANATSDYWRCMRRYYEHQRDYANAARIAVKQGEQAEAAKLYLRAGMKAEALNLKLEQADDPVEAAELLERNKRFAEAAERWEQAGNTPRAVRCRAFDAERSGDHRRAAEFWNQAGDTNRALTHQAQAFEKQQQWLEAAEIYEHLNQVGQLMHCLRRSIDPDATIWLKALELRGSDPIASARAFLELGRFDMSRDVCGRIYTIEATEIVFRCNVRELLQGDPHASVDELLRRPIHFRNEWIIPEELERIGRSMEAGRLFQNGCKYADAARCFEAAGDIRRHHRCQALEYQACFEYGAAAAHFELSGNSRDARKCHGLAEEQAGNLLEAAKWYDMCRMTAQARRCRELAESRA